MGGTKINDLMGDMDDRETQDDSMVDSIISELNKPSKNKLRNNVPRQLSQEEKNMLIQQQMEQQKMNNMRQQQMAQQQMAQQQMAQQQMAQQQMAQQQMGQPQMGQPQMGQPQMHTVDSIYEDVGMVGKIKNIIIEFKDILVVLVLITLFEMDVFKEPLSFKTFPFFYDIQNDKSKFSSFIMKGVIISLIFGTIQHFSK